MIIIIHVSSKIIKNNSKTIKKHSSVLTIVVQDDPFGGLPVVVAHVTVVKTHATHDNTQTPVLPIFCQRHVPKQFFVEDCFGIDDFPQRHSCNKRKEYILSVLFNRGYRHLNYGDFIANKSEYSKHTCNNSNRSCTACAMYFFCSSFFCVAMLVFSFLRTTHQCCSFFRTLSEE